MAEQPPPHPAVSTPEPKSPPAPTTRERPRNSALDLIRSLAALEVMSSHIRTFVFEDYPKLHAAGPLTNVFYFLTGFGRQSVFIFFVLSGFLVGGSVLAARPDGFWRRYSVQRLSRLWVVLLPCLAATLLWNHLGFHAGGADYLNGRMNPPVASAPFDGPVHLDLFTTLGNALFLQTRTTVVLGDNGPLWSLTNEFWYYVAFPLLYFALRKSSSTPLLLRALFVGGAAAALLLPPLPPGGLLMGFWIWLSGASAAAWVNSRFARLTTGHWYGVTSIVLCLVMLALSRVGRASDLWLSLSFTATLPYLLHLPAPPRWLGAVSAWLADFSYTLYLAHFPFVAFLWYTLLHSERLLPSATAAGRFVVLSAVALAYSYLLSLMFERHTDQVRRFVMKQISPRPPGK